MTGRILPPHGSGPTRPLSLPHVFRRADPDETEGRRLYRAQADARARMDLALDKRSVKLATATDRRLNSRKKEVR